MVHFWFAVWFRQIKIKPKTGTKIHDHLYVAVKEIASCHRPVHLLRSILRKGMFMISGGINGSTRLCRSICLFFVMPKICLTSVVYPLKKLVGPRVGHFPLTCAARPNDKLTRERSASLSSFWLDSISTHDTNKQWPQATGVLKRPPLMSH